MKHKLAVIMDPIAFINPKKDTTLAMLLEAQRRGYEIHYLEPKDLNLIDEKVVAHTQQLNVFNDEKQWYQFGKQTINQLQTFDVILMRKDPPFDIEYIYVTYLLEIAERQGSLVVNKPQALRDANEKLFTAYFPECCPDTLVSRNKAEILKFIGKHNKVVLKPLDSMGGRYVYLVNKGDLNTHVIIETLTHFGTRFMMAQQFIPDITVTGDKRIILIDGEPIPYALARIPKAGDIRGNLAAGGTGKGIAINQRDREICQHLTTALKQRGLLFVGIDVIGDYLTEINVTSPTCVREIDKAFNINISAILFDCIEQKIDGIKS